MGPRGRGGVLGMWSLSRLGRPPCGGGGQESRERGRESPARLFPERLPPHPVLPVSVCLTGSSGDLT